MASTDDYIAIRNLLARYCRGCDRVDPDLIRACYWEEAIDRHGKFTGTREEFITFVCELLRTAYRNTSHTLGQSYIEVDGDNAFVETYFRGFHLPADRADNTMIDLLGRYVDHMQRRNGEWRILERSVIVDGREVRPYEDHNVGDWAASIFQGGLKERGDPSYDVRKSALGS